MACIWDTDEHEAGIHAHVVRVHRWLLNKDVVASCMKQVVKLSVASQLASV